MGQQSARVSRHGVASRQNAAAGGYCHYGQQHDVRSWLQPDRRAVSYRDVELIAQHSAVQQAHGSLAMWNTGAVLQEAVDDTWRASHHS